MKVSKRTVSRADGKQSREGRKRGKKKEEIIRPVRLRNQNKLGNKNPTRGSERTTGEGNPIPVPFRPPAYESRMEFAV